MNHTFLKRGLVLSGAFALSSAVAFSAPSGHLGYLKQDRAIVSFAQTGAETMLPGNRVNGLALSPRGEALYFVVRPGQKLEHDYDAPICDAMLAKAPYKRAQKLPGLQGRAIYGAQWNPAGTAFSVSGTNISGVYSVANRQLDKGKAPQSQSQNGRLLAYADDEIIRVKDTATGRERVIFSIKNPQPLFAAMKAARNPTGIKEMNDAVDPELWKDANNWRMSAVALEPGGARLYFACNAGTSAGAAGNTTWALFTYDLTTGKLAVMSKTGEFFSRPPDVLQVSPDSKRLLILSSAHSSAIDNANSLFVIDLLTQASRELLLKQTPKGADTNLAAGACWSPDSKYVAFAATYYSAEALINRPDDDWEPKADAWRLFVAYAATGKIVRTIRSAISPSWGN